jgi:hypothetical protein
MRLYYRIKNFFVYGWDKFRRRCQRFQRGYSWGDVWDMDRWFIDMAKPMLTHLRDRGIGIPWDLYQDNAENERAAWEAVLTEMIECLDLMNEDAAHKYLCIADNDYTAASYRKVNDFMEEKKNRFFELFSKHFYSLWD